MKRLLFIPLLLLALSGYAQTIIRANGFYVAPAVAAGCGGGSSNYGDTDGSSAGSDYYNNYVYYNKITVTVCGTVSAVHNYCGAVVTDESMWGIYTDNGGVPGSLITNGATDVLTVMDDNAYNTWTFSTDPTVTSATDYWVGIMTNHQFLGNNGGGAVTLYYQARAYGLGFPATATPLLLGTTFDTGCYIVVDH